MSLRQPNFWSNPHSPLALILTPFSALWMLAAGLRTCFVKPYRSSLKVICVGNIAVGGSGKTPTCLALAAHLSDKKICFLTRGYGGKQKRAVVIADATDAKQ